MLLRIEDHDRGRCRPAYHAALLDDLAWMGLEPDLPSTGELTSGPSAFRQSDCDDVYAGALGRLAASHQVYACECSRRDIAVGGGDIADQETRYSGRCRALGLAEATGRGMRTVIENGEERFDDARLGAQRQVPADQCGDLLLRDRLGRWTYQFAVVVDDIRHGVDLVIRGEDLLGSTGRQLRLARMLGRAAPPVFVHHPLIVNPAGAKLSKARGDTGIRELRAAGVSAADVLGEAAARVGLLDRPAPLSPDDLAGLFDGR